MSKRKTKNEGADVPVSAPSPKRRIETSVNDKTQTIYVNNASIEVTNWDVRIKLGLIQSATPELVKTLDLIHVYMSHEHAKAFSESLTQTLERVGKMKLAEVEQPAKTH